jgi:hypothetical protein
VVFSFSQPFHISEEYDIMEGMGLSNIAPWDLPRLIPREVSQFVLVFFEGAVLWLL